MGKLRAMNTTPTTECSVPAEGRPPAHAGQTVLEVRGVTKRFAGVHALRGVDLTAQGGRVHALVGENGAGKSTLIKVSPGSTTPDAGTAAGGQVDDVSHADRARSTRASARSTRRCNLIPLMSVAQNIYLGREPRALGLIDFRQM